jgi:Fe-S-cluster containining protein
MYPPRVTPRVDFEAADKRLTSYVDRILSRAAARAGGELVCRPGCAECCAGLFPITQVDALRLRRGLAELATRDPLRAARVMRRAREAAALLGADLPADERARLSSDDPSREAFYLRHEALLCPALDPESGRCDLYESRPISCRTFGPPVCIEGVPLPPCRLCFTDASARRIDACRVDVDSDDLEAPMLALLESHEGLTGETLVAFALAESAPSAPPERRLAR